MGSHPLSPLAVLLLLLICCEGMDVEKLLRKKASTGSSPHPRTCPHSSVPPSVIEKTPSRLIAIGDIHGDINVLKQALKLGGVMGDDGRWTGGETVVVQTGDQIDSGGRHSNFPDPGGHFGEMVDLMDELGAQASSHGGAVYSLLGNHEFLNFDGDHRYHSDKDKAEFSHLNLRWGSEYNIRLVCSRNVIMKIGPMLFAHGGVSHLLEIIFGIDPSPVSPELFDRANMAVRTKALTGETGDEEFWEGITFSSGSVLWDRTWSDAEWKDDNKLIDTQFFPKKLKQELKDTKQCEMLASINRKLGVSTQILGHTIQKPPKINGMCGNGVWRLDVGMSKAFPEETHGPVQVLEVTNGKNFRVLSERPSSPSSSSGDN